MARCSPDAVSIRPEDPTQGAVTCMMRESDALYAALYPPEENHLLDPAELTGPDVTFLVARCDQVIAGFGAIAVRSEEDGEPYGEIKRMYVSPAMRGMGLGRRLLDALEAEARARGLDILRLETGNRQPEALGLYRAAGFTERGPFGGYAESDHSLYFEKLIN